MFFYYINDIIGNKWSDALRAKNGWTFFVGWFIRFACPPFSTQPAVRQLRHRLDPVQQPFALVSTLVPVYRTLVCSTLVREQALFS